MGNIGERSGVYSLGNVNQGAQEVYPEEKDLNFNEERTVRDSSDATAIYYARYNPPDRNDRLKGRNFGQKIDEGYHVKTQEDRFDVSTFGLRQGFQSTPNGLPDLVEIRKQGYKRLVEVIEDRTGRKGLVVIVY